MYGKGIRSPWNRLSSIWQTQNYNGLNKIVVKFSLIENISRYVIQIIGQLDSHGGPGLLLVDYFTFSRVWFLAWHMAVRAPAIIFVLQKVGWRNQKKECVTPSFFRLHGKVIFIFQLLLTKQNLFICTHLAIKETEKCRFSGWATRCWNYYKNGR